MYDFFPLVELVGREVNGPVAARGGSFSLQIRGGFILAVFTNVWAVNILLYWVMTFGGNVYRPFMITKSSRKLI